MLEVLGLPGVHHEAFTFPVDVREVQRRKLRRATETAEPGQCQDQPPSQIGTRFHDAVDGGAVNEQLALGIGWRRTGQVIERKSIDDAVAAEHPPEFLDVTHRFSSRGLGQITLFD
ncbi:MAG: hypothetical protein AAGA25_08170 [Planctomycetota bacterium]